MMNTRCTKLSMVRDDSKSSKTSNKKCPVVLHSDHIHYPVPNVQKCSWGSLRALKSYNLQLFSPELPQSLTWLVLVIQLIKFILQEKA